MSTISIFEYQRQVNKKKTGGLISNFKNFLLNSEELVLFLQQEQLNEGENKKGQIIGVYSAYTEILTNGRKKKGEPFNFQDTGSFFDEMYIKIQTSPEFSITIGSKDSKSKLIEEKYGNVFGLNPENTKVLQNQITQLFIRFLNKQGNV